jgi:hypothetical protein
MNKPAVISRSHHLERRTAATRRPWHEPDWQRLWLAAHKDQGWRSLALVPGGAGLPQLFIEKAAIVLSQTGMSHLGQNIQVADATRVQLADLNDFFAEVNQCTSNGLERVIIALAPLSENVTSVSIAQQSDCALLCLLRGVSTMKDARRTVKDVGAKRFIGSVIFDGLG